MIALGSLHSSYNLPWSFIQCHIFGSVDWNITPVESGVKWQHRGLLQFLLPSSLQTKWPTKHVEHQLLLLSKKGSKSTLLHRMGEGAEPLLPQKGHKPGSNNDAFY